MKIFSLRCFQKEEQLERGERDRDRERQTESKRGRTILVETLDKRRIKEFPKILDITLDL